MAHITPPDTVRELFARAMSTMYQSDVPQYGTLVELVADVNLSVLEHNTSLHEMLANTDGLARLNHERHGAIRVGTAQELVLLRRIFATMGMFPVGYYDLSVAGLPLHGTAFRPVDDQALRANPLRIFTSLLRPDCITDDDVRRRVVSILASRTMFNWRCRALLDLHEAQGGFYDEQAVDFIREVVDAFRWQHHAIVSQSVYQRLNQYHPLLADAVCFPGCHINHLASGTLDIDRVQALMPEYGITPQAVIEGPPRREHPILLRQTSFHARQDPVLFPGTETGSHRVRFGEVEQRGAALTPKGRTLYDRLLQEAGTGKDNLSHQLCLQRVFSQFPDSAALLRRHKLAYFRYRLTPQGESHRRMIRPGDDPQMLIERGWLEAHPIIYEDFLTRSAAGIFHGSLGAKARECSPGTPDQAALECALGCPLLDAFTLYQTAEDRSKQRCGLL